MIGPSIIINIKDQISDTEVEILLNKKFNNINWTDIDNGMNDLLLDCKRNQYRIIINGDIEKQMVHGNGYKLLKSYQSVFLLNK